MFIFDQENCSIFVPSSEDGNDNDTSSSDQTLKQFVKYIFAIHNWTLLVLPVISVLLNGCCFYIFHDKVWNNSILSILLKYLSASEVVFNVSGFFLTLTKFIDYTLISDHSKIFWILVLQFSTFLSVTGLICRNWTILHLAAYRFESICKPLRVNKVYKSTSIIKFLWATYLLASLVALPRTFEQVAYICKGYLQLQFGLLKYQLYRIGYQYLVVFSVQTVGPVLVTSILSMLMVRVIWRMRRFRQSRNSNSARNQKQMSGDVLMLFICFTFFTLEIPSIFSKLLQPYFDRNDKVKEDLTLAVMANLLVYLDSVINIFVYILSNRTFRKKLKKILHIQKMLLDDEITQMDSLRKTTYRP